jgi:hypothetical protein
MSDLDFSPEGLERLRRSIAMLSRGQPGLDREAAIRVLEHAQNVDQRLRCLLRELRALLEANESQT